MAAPSFRRATLSDTEDLARLFEQLSAGQTELEPSLGHRKADFDGSAAMRERLRTPSRSLWVIDADGAIVGFGECSRLVQYGNPGAASLRTRLRSHVRRWLGRPAVTLTYYESRTVGYIHNVFVDPSFRGRALGRGLLAVMMRDLAARGPLHGFHIDAVAANGRWLSTLADLGFRPVTIQLRREPDGGPAPPSGA